MTRRVMARRAKVWLPAAALAGLTVNAWIQAGTAALLILAMAGIGCAVAVVIPGYLSGAVVVKHAQHPDRQVEAGRARRAIEAAEDGKEQTR